MWKLSYLIENGFLLVVGEKCGLGINDFSDADVAGFILERLQQEEKARSTGTT